MSERFTRALDPTILDPTARALERKLLFWEESARPLDVLFAQAATQRDIVHGLETKPDGFFVVWADANITAVRGKLWTREVAYLQADVANARAVIIFYTLRETPAYG